MDGAHCFYTLDIGASLWGVKLAADGNYSKERRAGIFSGTCRGRAGILVYGEKRSSTFDQYEFDKRKRFEWRGEEILTADFHSSGDGVGRGFDDWRGGLQ